MAKGVRFGLLSGYLDYWWGFFVINCYVAR